MPMPPVEFELSIHEAHGPDDVEIEGVLNSPALHPGMHPDGKLGVFIFSRRSRPELKLGFVLDSFQIHSLLGYLNDQDSIRDQLERELAADQESIDPEGDPIRGEVWSWAEVESLHLRRRNGPEESETKAFFAVRIRCDWCPDHFLDASFLDGKFVGLE